MLRIDDMINAMEEREREERETERLYKAQKTVTKRFNQEYYYIDLRNPDVQIVKEAPESLFKAVSFIIGEDTFITYDAVIHNPDLYLASSVSKNLFDQTEGSIFCGFAEEMDLSVRQYNILKSGRLSKAKIDFREALFKLAHEDEFRLQSGKLYNPLKTRRELSDLVLFETRKKKEKHQDYSSYIENIIRHDLEILKKRNMYDGCPDLFSNNIFCALHKKFTDLSMNNNDIYERYEQALFCPEDKTLLTRSTLDVESIIRLLSLGYLYVDEVIMSAKVTKYDDIKHEFITYPDQYCLRELLNYASPVLRVHIPDILIQQMKEKEISSFSQLIRANDLSASKEIASLRILIEGAIASVVYGIPWKENNKESI